MDMRSHWNRLPTSMASCFMRRLYLWAVPFAPILTDMKFLQPSYTEGGLSAAQFIGDVWVRSFRRAEFLVIRRGRDQSCRAEVVLLMVVAMVVGTALATALGRLNFPIVQALSPRYATPALIFWSVVGLLSFS